MQNFTAVFHFYALSLLCVIHLATSVSDQPCATVGCFNAGVCGTDGNCICVGSTYSGKYCEEGITVMEADTERISLPLNATNGIVLSWKVLYVGTLGYAYEVYMPQNDFPEASHIEIVAGGDESVVYYSGQVNGTDFRTDSGFIIIKYSSSASTSDSEIVLRKTATCQRLGCSNDGSCENHIAAQYKCDCTPGYEGTFCEEDVYCNPNPCQHNGKCTHGAGGPMCNCEPRTTGNFCQFGFCDDTIIVGDQETYTSPGFPDADFESISCNFTLRANDSNSIVSVNITSLQLAVGAGDDSYFEAYDVVEADLVLLERITMDDIESYNSSLQSSRGSMAVYFEGGLKGDGFSIDFHEESIDYCQDFQCENGGTCLQNSHSAYCQCPTGVFGNHCQNATANLCTGLSVPCLHGGTCVPVNTTYYYCLCPPGYSGQGCQILLTTSTTPSSTSSE
jgi:hypothetical protein